MVYWGKEHFTIEKMPYDKQTTFCISWRRWQNIQDKESYANYVTDCYMTI
uniref:Uncharacterized protein n=1 Tax=Anguilla anguilla TaxID=7936 RepID=A0A0E9V7I6_ANGAN